MYLEFYISMKIHFLLVVILLKSHSAPMGTHLEGASLLEHFTLEEEFLPCQAVQGGAGQHLVKSPSFCDTCKKEEKEKTKELKWRKSLSNMVTPGSYAGSPTPWPPRR